MNSDLPATGTVALLELLAPLVPGDFINQVWPPGRTGGRHHAHPAAQRFRVHLLSLLSPVHSLNLLVKMLPEQRAWRTCAGLRRQNRGPDVRMLHEFRARLGVAGLRRINQHLLQPLVEAYAWREGSVAWIDAADLPAACGDFKKTPATTRRTAPRWAGARSRAGRAGAWSAASAHPLRLWLHDYTVGVQLVPWVSGVTPAKVSESGLLAPSRHYRQRQWDWCQPLVVAAMGYWAAAAKRQCRERWQGAVVTQLRSDMKLAAPYGAWHQAPCPQGEPVAWLGSDVRAGEHWFGAAAQPQLCGPCWAAARWPRQFADRPEPHESLLGRWPLVSAMAQRVWQQVRPWIEPAQAYERNQLGLGSVFLNGLRCT